MSKFPLVGHVIDEIWTGRREQVSTAWGEGNTAAIHTSIVVISRVGLSNIEVFPCEVPVDNLHPALGITLQESTPRTSVAENFCTLERLDEIQEHLPAQITEVLVWDALGEGPDSAIRISLHTGVDLVIRHVMPPLSLGLHIKKTAGDSLPTKR